MMNELLFLIQILLILIFSYGAFRLGKEALIASVTIQSILANLFVLKQMTFLGFNVTCSDAFAIGSILALNLLREYFGKEEAKKGIKISFILMVFFVVLSKIHILFIPSAYDTSHDAFQQLLAPAPRLLFASLAVFYLMQKFDLYAFGWLTKAFPRFSFPIRNSISLTFSQLLDTILFSFLGLYGIVDHILHIILISFLLKLCIILLFGPFTYFIKTLRKNV